MNYSRGVLLAVGAALALVSPRIVSAQVRFERTGYRLTSIGERLAVSARLVDSRRRPVANANIRWRIADPSIASVNAQGVVVSRRVGYTKLWAVAGGDSASALILVDQWAAKFDFAPAIVRFDAVGSKMPLKVFARDAAGHLINEQNRKTATCRSLNERVAALAPNGELTARANGVTHVRCTDRGIADSVRVEVRQRPVRAVIVDKLSIGAKMVGDTFRLRLAATDRVGDDVRDVQPTWASSDPRIVNVDPLTGLARSIGPGEVKIVGQVGDVTDTVGVTVALPAGMVAPQVVAEADTGLVIPESRVPTLRLQSLYLTVGDTAAVIAKDATGVTISSNDIALRSSNTDIVTAVSGQRVVAQKTGRAYIVATLGALVDSTLVDVRVKGAASTAATAAATVNFVRPKFDTAAARIRYAARLDSAAGAIRRASVVAEPSGRMISMSGVAAQVSHASLQPVPSATGVEDEEARTGLLYGGTAELAPHRMLKATVDLRTGVLSMNADRGLDMNVTEAEANLTFAPTSWLALRGGRGIRSERDSLALQRWEFTRVSVVTRFTFVGGAVSTIAGFSVLPGAKYTGYIDNSNPAAPEQINPDPFSFAGEAGMQVNVGWLSASLLYYAEKFTFKEYLGVKRKDRFSSLRLRLGLQAGRN